MIMSLDESLSSASLEECSVTRSNPTESGLAATAVAAATSKSNTHRESVDDSPVVTAKSSVIVDGSNVVTKPKRPLSAYNLFFRRERELLLEALPSRNGRKPKRSHGKINFNDLAKTIAAKWKEISPEEKEEYERIAAVGREKYVKLAKAWKKQQRKLAKQKKRQQAEALTTKETAQPTSKPPGKTLLQRFESNEHSSPPSSAMDETKMTGKVSSSLLQQDCEINSNILHCAAPSRADFSPEINLMRASSGDATLAYEPIPAFEDLEPSEPTEPTLPFAHYETNYHQLWNQPTDMALAVRDELAFDNYNMTSDSLIRGSPARNTYAFDHVQDQRRGMMLRPSSSMPHMASSVNSTWNGNFTHTMDQPRRLHSLPMPSTTSSFNATWDNSMGNVRMMQQPLPFPPSGSNTYGGPSNGFPTLFETSLSSLDYYASTEQQDQLQRQPDNFPELQPDPLPFNSTVASQQGRNFQQTSEATTDTWTLSGMFEGDKSS